MRVVVKTDSGLQVPVEINRHQRRQIEAEMARKKRHEAKKEAHKAEATKRRGGIVLPERGMILGPKGERLK